jgi:hypothetical protein
MRKSVIKFLDDRFGDFELLPYENSDYTFYLANKDLFNGVINKQLNIFHINYDLYKMVRRMFGIDDIQSEFFIQKWVEKTFGMRNCEIRQIRRNEL